MGLSDPFQTTYEGSFKAGSTLGAGISSAVGDVSAGIEKKRSQEKAYNMLKQFGMIKETQEDPSYDELKKNAEEFAKSQGRELIINDNGDENQSKQALMNIYKALEIPIPKGKTKTELNLSPGTKYDPIKGEVSFESPKSLLSQFGLTESVPEGFEITGYDQKGQPMIRKVKEDKVPASVQNLKTKMRGELNETIETNKVQRDKVALAKSALDRLPSGFLGNMSMKMKRMAGSDDPIMGDWQTVKQVLTDDTLLNTARTKGAISDQEMELFKQSAANDDLLSKPAARVVFDKLVKFIDAEEKAKRDTFEQSFPEDATQSTEEAVVGNDDFSTMSDDELRRIAGGGG
jgi:hypothetical protein